MRAARFQAKKREPGNGRPPGARGGPAAGGVPTIRARPACQQQSGAAARLRGGFGPLH
ncbi:protein of unknown function [Burkholderia multivorans]